MAQGNLQALYNEEMYDCQSGGIGRTLLATPRPPGKIVLTLIKTGAGFAGGYLVNFAFGTNSNITVPTQTAAIGKTSFSLFPYQIISLRTTYSGYDRRCCYSCW